MTEWDGNPKWYMRDRGSDRIATTEDAPPPTGALQQQQQQGTVAPSPPAAPQTAQDEQSMLSSNSSSRRTSTQVATKPAPAQQRTTKPQHQQQWFEFLPLQASVKPTLRPRFPCSKKNQATSDSQAARDGAAAEARAARYLQQAAALRSHPHHATLQLGPVGAVAQEHVVLGDRGKHRPAWCRSSTSYDPITGTSRPVTAPGRSEARAGLLSPAQGSNRDDVGAASDSSRPQATLFCSSSRSHAGTRELLVVQRKGGGVRTPSQGRYDVLTHSWLEPPSDATLAEQGWATGRTDSTGGRRRSGSAGGGGNSSSGSSNRDTVGQLLRQQSGDAMDNMPGRVDGSGSRPGSAGGRHTLRNGPSWGTYNVLTHEWTVPPADARCLLREVKPSGLGVDRLAATAGGLAPILKTSPKHAQGSYDPIKGEWKVSPASARAERTLDFAPRALFQQQAFVHQ